MTWVEQSRGMPDGYIPPSASLKGANMANEKITPHIAATTLWHFGENGTHIYPTGEWRELLIKLIVKSDAENRAKLGAAFPGEVAAVNVMQHRSDGVALLRRIAESGDPTDPAHG